MAHLLERLVAALGTVWRQRHGAVPGQGMVEYAAILSFVAAVMVLAELYLAPHINMTLDNIANSLP